MGNNQEAVNGFNKLMGIDEGKIELTTLEPLELVTKLGRVARSITPPSDREVLTKSSIKSALTIFNLIINVLIKMDKCDNTVLRQSAKEKIISLKEAFEAMLERGLDEYDYSVIKETYSTYKVVESLIKTTIARWYMTHDLGNEINSGAYDEILKDVIECSFSNMEFLGVF